MAGPHRIRTGFLWLQQVVEAPSAPFGSKCCHTPFAAPGERRGRRRLDGRVLTWFPYCGLFTTLFVPPSADDALGLLRFFGITLLVAAVVIGMGWFVQRRGAVRARALYATAVAPYGGLVLLVAVATSILMR